MNGVSERVGVVDRGEGAGVAVEEDLVWTDGAVGGDYRGLADLGFDEGVAEAFIVAGGDEEVAVFDVGIRVWQVSGDFDIVVEVKFGYEVLELGFEGAVADDDEAKFWVVGDHTEGPN